MFPLSKILGSPRDKSTVINLDGKRVWKEFFLKILTINKHRFTTDALNICEVESLSPIDNHGKHSPEN